MYIPKKSREIYNETIAHRGFHIDYPENTLSSYEEAAKRGLAIELDVRMTKDKYLVCIHDRHTKRLLGVNGKTSHKTYAELRKYTVLNSDERVPTLKEVLDIVDGKNTILIETKGNINSEYIAKLNKAIKNYHGKLYFHSKNLLTYYKLVNMYKGKVFWILNPFRKRFKFIKGKDYRKIKLIYSKSSNE